MAVPKRKTSPSVRGKRRSHSKLKFTNIVINKTSGSCAVPHCISMDGYYDGKLVVQKKNK